MTTPGPCLCRTRSRFGLSFPLQGRARSPVQHVPDARQVPSAFDRARSARERGRLNLGCRTGPWAAFMFAILSDNRLSDATHSRRWRRPALFCKQQGMRSPRPRTHCAGE
eukprot:3607699-Pyramimonas_sp.AAC.1